MGLGLTLPFVEPAALTLGFALVVVVAVVFFATAAPFFADAAGLAFLGVAAAADNLA